MARLSTKDLVLSVLREVGVNMSEESIEQAIKSLRKTTKKTQNAITFDDYFNGDTENYRIALNSDAPFAVLQSMYYDNPELFKQVFRLVRIKQKRTAVSEAEV